MTQDKLDSLIKQFKLVAEHIHYDEAIALGSIVGELASEVANSQGLKYNSHIELEPNFSNKEVYSGTALQEAQKFIDRCMCNDTSGKVRGIVLCAMMQDGGKPVVYRDNINIEKE